MDVQFTVDEAALQRAIVNAQIEATRMRLMNRDVMRRIKIKRRNGAASRKSCENTKDADVKG